MTATLLPENTSVRTVGMALDDRTIERYMRREIIALGDQRPLRVKVNAFNGMVLLVGEVETNYAKDYLEEQARHLKAARRIFNRITVEQPLTKYAVLEDLLLAGKMRFALSGLDELKDSDMDYFVDRQRIYLMGIVTRSQADIVIRRMSAIEGVDTVVVAFEYEAE